MKGFDPMATFKSRYAYVRVTLRAVNYLGLPVEVIAGVEVERLVSAHAQYGAVRAELEKVLTPDVLSAGADDTLAILAESVIARCWPNKSYFVEVGRGTQDEWVQVYAP